MTIRVSVHKLNIDSLRNLAHGGFDRLRATVPGATNRTRTIGYEATVQHGLSWSDQCRNHLVDGSMRFKESKDRNVSIVATLRDREEDEFRSYEIHCRGMAGSARTDAEREQWNRLADAWSRKRVAAVAALVVDTKN
jgi:hypothetical protein